MCSEVLLIELECNHCKVRFYICRKCYRGHVYCSGRCRSEAQLIAHRKAQSQYRTSDKGRKAHSRNEKKRRMGKTNKKTMADESTNTPPMRVILYPIVQNTTPRCSFCGVYGKIVEVFPRR
jgi:hypothetical protein